MSSQGSIIKVKAQSLVSEALDFKLIYESIKSA